jgi:hypothetical protein
MLAFQARRTNRKYNPRAIWTGFLFPEIINVSADSEKFSGRWILRIHLFAIALTAPKYFVWWRKFNDNIIHPACHVYFSLSVAKEIAQLIQPEVLGSISNCSLNLPSASIIYSAIHSKSSLSCQSCLFDQYL